MDQITFENLPRLVGEIRDQLSRIEKQLNTLKGSDISNKHLMTISEAAEFLNLSTSTIYGKVCKMEIPVHKKGKRLYFERQELYDWIKNGRRKTVEELQQAADDFLKKSGSKGRRSTY